jgi:hypothetical protein
MILDLNDRFEAVRGPRRLWIAGFLVGLAGGCAILLLSPAAVAPEVALLVLLAARSPRLFGPGGALVGHGVAWCVLTATSSMSCASSCFYTLPYGPAHLENGEAWVAETRWWFGLAAAILIAGLVVTAVAIVAVRRKSSSNRPSS